MNYKYTKFRNPDEGELIRAYFDELITHLQNEVETFLNEAKYIMEAYEDLTGVKLLKEAIENTEKHMQELIMNGETVSIQKCLNDIKKDIKNEKK